jgi:hypothetical protein
MCLWFRLLDLLLAAALGQDFAAQNSAQHVQLATSSCCWREPHANLFKSLLDLAPQHVLQQLPAVIAALEAAVQQPVLGKSASFGQLLMALHKSFAAAFSKQQVEQLQGVVGRTATFMTKTLSSKFQQLQQQHAQAL